MFLNVVISHCMYKICLHFLTPLSTGNCAEHFDAYLIASCPSQSDLSTTNDQRSPHKSIQSKIQTTKQMTSNKTVVSMNALTYVSGYLLRKCHWYFHVYFVLLIISDMICLPQYDEKHRSNSMVIVLKSTPMLFY